MSIDKKPLLAYVRQSRAVNGETEDNSLSLEQQEESIKEWADRNGYHLAGFVKDHDFTGRTLNRPGVEELRSKAHPGITVGVWKYDRLARSVLGMATLVDEFERNGSRVVSVTEPDGKLPRQILSIMGEYYSDQLSERITAIREAQARRGDFTGGQPPYGYMREHTTTYVNKDGSTRPRQTGPLVPHPDESEVVREVYRRFMAGDSLYAISVDLVERGVPRSMGGTWNTTIIHKMLSNPFLAGYATHKKSVVGIGKHQPIIDPGEWALVQNRLQRRPKLREDSPHDVSSWLEGFIYHECGARMYLIMTGSTHHPYPNFVCKYAQGPYRCNVPRISIAKQKVETMVSATLVADLSGVSPLAEAIGRAEARAGGKEAKRERKRLEDKRAKEERKFAKAREEWLGDEESGLTQWLVDKARFTASIAAVDAEIAALPAAPDVNRYLAARDLLAQMGTATLASDAARGRALELLGVVIFSKDGIQIRYHEPFSDFLGSP